MGKKRACRRTEEENVIHERAVKLRKMTDDQLCQYIERERAQCIEDAYKDGYEAGRQTSGSNGKSVEEYLKTLQEAGISGIWAVTLNKLLKVAKENGYI